MRCRLGIQIKKLTIEVTADSPEEFLPLQFAALKVFSQLVSMEDKSGVLGAEIWPKEKDELYRSVLKLTLSRGGISGNEIVY